MSVPHRRGKAVGKNDACLIRQGHARGNGIRSMRNVGKPRKGVAKEGQGDTECQAQVFKLHFKSNGETSGGL